MNALSLLAQEIFRFYQILFVLVADIYLDLILQYIFRFDLFLFWFGGRYPNPGEKELNKSCCLARKLFWQDCSCTSPTLPDALLPRQQTDKQIKKFSNKNVLNLFPKGHPDVRESVPIFFSRPSSPISPSS